MKLMKKMSAFVVALTFLFVFSIKANAAESYKVGDKVLFGDFGGHVIEDSDSSSNTVKVFVDGWNKTKEQWDEYWKNYFTTIDDYFMNDEWAKSFRPYYYDDDKFILSIEIAIKKSIKNLNGYIYDFDNDVMNLSSLKSLQVSGGSEGMNYYAALYSEKDTYDWLLHENYRLYGNGVLKLNSSSHNYKILYGHHNSSVRYISRDEFDSAINKYNALDKSEIKSVILDWINDDINMYESLKAKDENWKNAKYIYPVGYSNGFSNLIEIVYDNKVVIGDYVSISLDKSNLIKVVDKCDDYSDNYKITYETNGGDKIDAVSVTGNKDLAIPKREGYIFDGWYTDSNFTTKVSSITPTEKRTDTCIKGFNDVTVYAKWNKELKDEKVTILGEEKTLEKVSSIAVKLLDKVTANIVGTLKAFTAYDITLKDVNGKSVEPSGKVKLSLVIPKDYDKNNIGVYREDGDKLIEYAATINGEYAEIETDHFSTYIVGEKAEVKNEEKTTTKVSDEISSKDDSNIQNPKTGDNMTIFFILGLLLVGGIVIIGKKLKESK